MARIPTFPSNLLQVLPMARNQPTAGGQGSPGDAAGRERLPGGTESVQEGRRLDGAVGGGGEQPAQLLGKQACGSL